ncbi:hypothetical protein SAMN05216188_11718 [Lentzea xinjiangensis]|uniref:Uncharacterized protein n=1 Tax=Lentzea xinjiangensis TaxID=402600 RepID=A0A1H9SW60_9PSEU|nr:hypothetical protein [Lentzea xinjiangensis]SER89128.1 hypothetical protein SAMN05216188_11718 [Lentzea xinjiangensis]
MTLHAANDLFSHPETHQPHVPPAPSHVDQPSWANLFQEPPITPRAPSEN